MSLAVVTCVPRAASPQELPITTYVVRRYLVDEALPQLLVPTFLLALAPAPAATPVPETATPARVEGSAPFEGSSPELPRPTSNAARMPKARTEIRLPSFSGEALSFVGASLGGLGVLFKISGTIFATDAAKEADRREADPSSEIPEDPPIFELDFNFRGVVSNVIAASLLTSSVPLLGSGMGMYGRWVAHSDAAAGRPYDRRGTGLMIGLGCGAIGLGITSLVITSFADDSAQTHAKSASIREAGYWTGTAGILGGASLAGYGVGYHIARSRLEPRLHVRIAPLVSYQLMGAGVAGSF
jgi:hypothetical protein